MGDDDRRHEFAQKHRVFEPVLIDVDHDVSGTQFVKQAYATWKPLGPEGKLTLDVGALKTALFPDGSPATPEEFRRRLHEHLETLLKGRDEKKVRIVLA